MLCATNCGARAASRPPSTIPRRTRGIASGALLSADPGYGRKTWTPGYGDLSACTHWLLVLSSDSVSHDQPLTRLNQATTRGGSKWEKESMRTQLSLALVLLKTFSLAAQTPAQLKIQTHAGLTITGSVGTVYAVESVTDLVQTNNPSTWQCLEYVQLPASPYLWVDKSVAAAGKRFYRAVAMEAPRNMVFIPPGTFRMGSPTNEVDRWDEGPQMDVIISRGFWMGKYEVTQGEYLAVMGNNPSWFRGDTNRPVDTVRWYEATNYCHLVTLRESAAGRIPANCVYRLPTEAEWEYACRGGTSTRFSYGDDPGYHDWTTGWPVGYTNLTDYAWYGLNSENRTHPVGQKLPNLWGLYDMHGNVREWCQDWFAAYPGGLQLDPQGPASGSYCVNRGGDYGSWPKRCRSAQRENNRPASKPTMLGFRVVLAPRQP